MIKKYEKRAIFPRRLMEFLTIPHAYKERERERKREELEKADVCEVDKRKLQGVEQRKGHGGVERNTRDCANYPKGMKLKSLSRGKWNSKKLRRKGIESRGK